MHWPARCLPDRMKTRKGTMRLNILLFKLKYRLLWGAPTIKMRRESVVHGRHRQTALPRDALGEGETSSLGLANTRPAEPTRWEQGRGAPYLRTAGARPCPAQSAGGRGARRRRSPSRCRGRWAPARAYACWLCSKKDRKQARLERSS